MPLKRAIFATKQDKSLIIKDLSQNIIKSRIFAFLRARESLIENTRVLEGIVVKIFDSYHCFSFYHFSSLLHWGKGGNNDTHHQRLRDKGRQQHDSLRRRTHIDFLQKFIFNNCKIIFTYTLKLQANILYFRQIRNKLQKKAEVWDKKSTKKGKINLHYSIFVIIFATYQKGVHNSHSINQQK